MYNILNKLYIVFNYGFKTNNYKLSDEQSHFY